MSGALRLFDVRSWGVPFKLAMIAGLGLVFLDDLGALGPAERTRAAALCVLGGLLVAMEGEGWRRAQAEQWARSFGTPLVLGGVARSVLVLGVLWAVQQFSGPPARDGIDLAWGLAGAGVAWWESGRRALGRGEDGPSVSLGETLAPSVVLALVALVWVGPSSGLIVLPAVAAYALAARRIRAHGSAALSP